jgi:hypothetical protein
VKKEINDAILSVIKKAGDAADSHEAMRFSQSALNLAHVLGLYVNAEREEKLPL